mgnify:CR=1 FL=1
MCCTDHGPRADGLQVVAIQCDIERAARNRRALRTGDHFHDSLRELHTTTLNADEHEPVGTGVQFNDLVGHATQRAVEGTRVEYRFWLVGHARRIYRADAISLRPI